MTKPTKVIVLEATDWAFVAAQVDTDTAFAPIRGHVCGFLVKETKQYITITQQWFVSENQVRQTLTIPKLNIKKRSDLAVRLKKK
jgi:hypothetical protein